MTPPDPARDLLLAALRATPRRHRLPPLPGHPEAAAAAAPDVGIAFALEAARTGAFPQERLEPVFTQALARLVRQAVDADPDFQANLLRDADADVRAFVELAQVAPADERTLRTRVDAIAHPGKLRGMAEGALRSTLLQLHGTAAEGDWPAVAALLAGASADFGALAQEPALARLLRLHTLRSAASVQRYLAMRARSGPLAGSADAQEAGRAAARGGSAAEMETLQAFDAIAGVLARLPGAATFRVAGSLRVPAGFPARVPGAKDEWDAALLRQAAGNAAEVLLLAEVKLSPAAATQDRARLLRGLARLAQADGDASYAFASSTGRVALSGASLRALQPRGDDLPPHVFYASPSPGEERTAVLVAAARSVLLGEPASLAFAARLQKGHAPAASELAPVWHAVTGEPRLRATLHQYDTARRAREAMVHPQDLLEEVRTRLSAPPAAR